MTKIFFRVFRIYPDNGTDFQNLGFRTLNKLKTTCLKEEMEDFLLSFSFVLFLQMFFCEKNTPWNRKNFVWWKSWKRKMRKNKGTRRSGNLFDLLSFEKKFLEASASSKQAKNHQVLKKKLFRWKILEWEECRLDLLKNSWSIRNMNFKFEKTKIIICAFGFFKMNNYEEIGKGRYSIAYKILFCFWHLPLI